MNNDFDVAIEDFGVTEEVTQSQAGIEFTCEQKYAPWHKPRKQWVRGKQWWGSIASYLIKENDHGVGPQTVRYFGLPGCQSARNFDHVSALKFDQATETISGA